MAPGTANFCTPTLLQHLPIRYILLQYEHKAVYDLVNKGHPKRDVKVHSESMHIVLPLAEQLEKPARANSFSCCTRFADWLRSQSFPSA